MVYYATEGEKRYQPDDIFSELPQKGINCMNEARDIELASDKK